jgi:hypothetical protein
MKFFEDIKIGFGRLETKISRLPFRWKVISSLNLIKQKFSIVNNGMHR